MDVTENLPTDRVEQQLRRLLKSRTLVRCQIDQNAYDQVTIVTGVQMFDNKLYFCLDHPEAVQKFLADSNDWKLTVEFTEKGASKHFLEARSGFAKGGMFWLEAPPSMERIQRRRNFRLKAPMGAYLEVLRNRRLIRLGLIDLSLGGVLCLVDSVNPQLRRSPIFKEGRTFKGARMVIPTERGQATVISVSKARVVRKNKNDLTGAYQYGLMFMTLDPEAEKALKELLYRLQRAYLRKRKILRLK